MDPLTPLILAEIVRSMCYSTRSLVVNAVRFKSNVRALNESLKRLEELKTNMKKHFAIVLSEDKPLRLKLTRWEREVEQVARYGPVKSRLSKKLIKTLKVAQMLEKEGLELLDVFSSDTILVKVEHIPGVSILHQKTASKMLARITTCLTSNKANKIGVWGMGGVGKTTLIRTLNNKLGEEDAAQPFGLVIYVTVSKEFNMRRLQKHIAGRLGIDTNVEESEEKLARKIYDRLAKEPSFLLILDDVWTPVDLDHLGVPQVEIHAGCKVIMTSRFLEVCRSMRTDLDVRVDCLSEEDAWELFCQNAGEVVKSNSVITIAKAVSRECGGFPLAIVTVGTAMRGKTNVKLWKHALSKLSKSQPWIKSIEEKIFQHLKWSYDFLESKAKSCFLLCALFPEDYSIEVKELVMYWRAEGLLEEHHSEEDSINEAIAIVENLKDFCFLEDGSREDTVKMHDVVRDFAIWVMSSSQNDCHSLVISGKGVEDVRQDKFAQTLWRVSLMNNKLERLPNLAANYCVQSSVLLLQGNSLLEEAPIRFLQAFPSLRILNLSGTRVKSLPRSVLQMAGLHSFFLRDCVNLVELPPLGTLATLELLDLSGTNIKEFPRGLEELNNFRHLDLSHTLHLEFIPSGVVSLLSNLETLDMTSSHYHWKVQVEAQQGEATFEELGCILRLQALYIELHSSQSLLNNNNIWIKKVKTFQLFVGSGHVFPTRHDKRRLAITHLNLAQGSIGWLLASTTSLALSHCQGIEVMIYNLVHEKMSFENLRSLTIENTSIKLTSRRASTTINLLPNLEELHLRRVDDLETLSELQIHLGLTLEFLKLLEITMCPKLRTLLGERNFRSIQNLEEIEISYCDSFQSLHEALFYYDPFLPNLRVMKLRNSPKLVSINRWGETWGCLEYVEVVQCEKLDHLPISSSSCGRVKEIKGELSWWQRLAWEDPHVVTTLHPFFKPVQEFHLLLL